MKFTTSSILYILVTASTTTIQWANASPRPLPEPQPADKPFALRIASESWNWHNKYITVARLRTTPLSLATLRSNPSISFRLLNDHITYTPPSSSSSSTPSEENTLIASTAFFYNGAPEVLTPLYFSRVHEILQYGSMISLSGGYTVTPGFSFTSNNQLMLDGKMNFFACTGKENGKEYDRIEGLFLFKGEAMSDTDGAARGCNTVQLIREYH